MRKTPEEELDFGKRFIRGQYGLLVGKPKNRLILISKLKDYLNFPDLSQAIDHLETNPYLRSIELIYGNPLPRSYEELGVCESIGTSEHISAEINWILISIRQYSYQLNLFLYYKEEYEAHLLRGNYSEAEQYLDKIENEICFSLWGLENRFLLKECENKSSENKAFLANFNLDNKSEGYTKSLAHYLSNRSERTLSVNRYNSDLQAALNRIVGGKKQEHIDYYFFKLSILNNFTFQKYPEILSYDSKHSILDRYLTLRNVLGILLADDPAESIDKDKLEENIFLKTRVNYLLRKISDPVLSKTKLFSGDSLFPVIDEQNSRYQIAIIDKYTTGFYFDVESELNSYLLEHPNHFDFYLLYIKSLIYQHKKFEAIGNPKSLQNQILYDLYVIISATGNPLNSESNLLRIANNLTSCVMSFAIFDFVNARLQTKRSKTIFAKLSYSAANPILYQVLPNCKSQKAYLEALAEAFPNSISIRFLLSKLNGQNNLEEFETMIPEAQYKSELASSYQAKNQWHRASELWQYVIKTHAGTAPIIENAIRNLFVCYENEERYDECIGLYVNSYLENPYLVKKISVSSLVKKIRENRFRIVKPNIELPIFYTVCDSDENELHTAFEKFNYSNKVTKPSELIPKFEEYPFEKILYYLKITCNLEVLKHSIYINGSKDRLEERLAILQFLKDKDTSDKEVYDSEIKQISNILIIQKGLIDLDDGKIYVNEQGIIQNDLKEYEAIYSRFHTIAGIADKNKKALFVNKGRLTTLDYSEENTEGEKIEYSNNPVYDLYLELFDAITAQFLYSKYGIVAYLSTRIRHGVLLGEIRPVFEKHKLITLKEGSSLSYRRNYYWDGIYKSESKTTIDKLQTLLSEFSLKVDGLIFDLIKSYLQVYHPDTNKEGWFNYSFAGNDLFWHSIKSLNTTDFSSFVHQVFEILWDRTDENLITIRQNIQTTVLQQFNELFDSLERDVINELGPGSNEIVNAIKACSTETQIVVNRVSGWFKRSGKSASDFQLDHLIDIVMEYTNKSHANKVINLERELECNCRIKGVYLTHFADLFRIFMENILKHSDEKVPVIDAKITTNIMDNTLGISIENTITNPQSIEALKTVWTNKDVDISKLLSEGKSGYHKAYKILQYDFLDKNNYLFTSLNDDEDLFTVTMLIQIKDLLA